MPKDDWNRQAANLLKAELSRVGINYPELLRRLQAMGLDETYPGLAAKINRGTFSFAFFMQCMGAIGCKTIRLGE
jgi:hypothetical protein